MLSLMPSIYLAIYDASSNDDKSLLSYVPGAMIHLILTTTQDRYYYYTHLQIRKLRRKHINTCPRSHT